MASMNNLFFSPVFTPQRRVAVRAPATGKGGGSRGSGSTSTEEKGIVDFILGGLTKQEQFYETDPIFSKDGEEEKRGTTNTAARRKNSAAPPPPKKKNGGFGLGGLFAKK